MFAAAPDRTSLRPDPRGQFDCLRTAHRNQGRPSMPQITTDDGVKLFYEETGTEIPVVFVHESPATHRSWEGQLRHFGRRYRCIAYNARGYPPSDVPENPETATPRPAPATTSAPCWTV